MGIVTGQDLVDLLLTQEGDEYIFGVEVSEDDENPLAFDCSELVQWGCSRLKVKPKMPDGAIYQVRHCNRNNNLISVDDAISTAGALLFRFSANPFSGGRPSTAHVAVSQGNGKTIEARGTQFGVGQFSAYGRGWTHGGLIPGIEYGEEWEEV